MLPWPTAESIPRATAASNAPAWCWPAYQAPSRADSTQQASAVSTAGRCDRTGSSGGSGMSSTMPEPKSARLPGRAQGAWVVMGILEASGLAHTLPDGRLLFRDVSFRVGAGSVVAVVGANGAGKTTL